MSSTGGFDFSKLKCIPRSFYLNMTTGRLKYGDILIVKDGATTGKTSFVDSDFPFEEAAINEHVFLLRVNSQMAEPYFVYEFLRSPYGRHLILKDFRGATVGGISRGFVDKVSIPLPSLSTQKRISVMLRMAKSTCTQIDTAIAQADDLLMSQFLREFGDPVTNPKGWPAQTLGDLVERDRGISYGVVQRGTDYRGGVPLIRISNIAENRFDASGIVYTDPANSQKYKRTIIKGGEILLSIRGTVGRVAIAPEEMRGSNVTREIAVIPLTEAVDRQFVRLLMLTAGAQQFMSGEIRGVAQRGVNLKDVRRLPVLLPSDQAMKLFRRFFSVHKQLQQNLREASRLSQELFDCLTQRAFQGSLLDS